MLRIRKHEKKTCYPPAPKKSEEEETKSSFSFVKYNPRKDDPLSSFRLSLVVVNFKPQGKLRKEYSMHENAYRAP